VTGGLKLGGWVGAKKFQNPLLENEKNNDARLKKSVLLGIAEGTRAMAKVI